MQMHSTTIFIPASCIILLYCILVYSLCVFAVKALSLPSHLDETKKSVRVARRIASSCAQVK